jgi:hypothetical protein
MFPCYSVSNARLPHRPTALYLRVHSLASAGPDAKLRRLLEGGTPGVGKQQKSSSVLGSKGFTFIGVSQFQVSLSFKCLPVYWYPASGRPSRVRRIDFTYPPADINAHARRHSADASMAPDAQSPSRQKHDAEKAPSPKKQRPKKHSSSKNQLNNQHLTQQRRLRLINLQHKLPKQRIRPRKPRTAILLHIILMKRLMHEPRPRMALLQHLQA